MGIMYFCLLEKIESCVKDHVDVVLERYVDKNLKVQKLSHE